MRQANGAQLSLEFLLIMAGMLAALALFLPVASKAASAGMHCLEIQRANSFLEGFSAKAERANFLGEGTSLETKAVPMGEWQFSVESEKAAITVKSERLGKEKTISSRMPANTEKFAQKITKKTVFTVTKSGGKLVIQPR